jgi:hypothetical protein
MGYRQRLIGTFGSEYVVDRITGSTWRMVGFLECEDGERVVIRKVGITGKCKIVRPDEVGERYGCSDHHGRPMDVEHVAELKKLYAKHVKGGQ